MYTSFILFFALACFSAIEAHDGDATYYDVEVGYTACGTRHSNNEYIAATAFSWWTSGNPNNDPMCQKRARVTNPRNGRTITVNIKDKCSGCKRGDLDFTPSAFQALGEPLEKGRFRIRWDFV